MLTALHIQDIVLIDQLSLSLGEGLTALTGETGAGKSILLDALGLACGGRASRTAVREGAAQGVVTVAFEPGADHPVWSVLTENGLDRADDQVILRRVQGKDGRGRGYINDQPVSITMLRTIGEALQEIHGQHDGRGFLTAATHRDLLDDFGGHEKQVASVKSAWTQWRSAVTALEEKQRDRDRALREADYLRHVVGELTDLAPVEGEEAELVGARTRLMATEKMLDDVRAACDAVDDDALEEKLARASRHLETAANRQTKTAAPYTGEGHTDDQPTIDFSAAASRLESALSEVMEARGLVQDLAEAIDPDPQAMDRVEERLFALRAAARKHGVAPEALHGFFARSRESLDLLENDEVAFGALEATVKTAKTDYDRAAHKLSQNRHKIAAILDKAVMSELAPLKLGRAVFSTDIVSDAGAPMETGIDQVEFMVATNPGAPKGPLKTIASGGELSRFVLAMKAAIASKEHRTVIIFDEVDAGVGGAVADAVGERLARLARDAQVLVVTHSPQVAARAQIHWNVAKEQTDTATLTRVMPLDDDERVEEIARMLAGAKITDAARDAAQQLLAPDASGKEKPATRTIARAKKTTTKTGTPGKSARKKAS
ncbi:MAG: DNA repair protein RecN [Pseudomonadota bacterium]